MGKALEAMWHAIYDFFELDDLEFDDVTLSPEVIEEICQFSKDVYPKEFVALLGGEVRKHVLIVDRLIFQPFTNTPYSSHIRLDLPMLSGSVGSVHSHPGPGNMPSKQDLRFFNKIGGVHLIISNPFRKRDIRLYLGDGTSVHYKIGNSERKS